MIERFVDLPGVKQAPPSLLAKLREIDHRAELVYVETTQAGDVWWLGTVRNNEERRKIGVRILANESKRGASANRRNVLLGKLLTQGFARIEAYTAEGDPESGIVRDSEGYECSIVEDFDQRDMAWRADQGEAQFQINLDRSMGGPEDREGVRVMRDKLATDGRDEFRRTKRQRRVFSHS